MNSNQSALNGLTETVYDSLEGYRKAAETANSPDLKRILTEQATKRQRTLDTLNGELARVGCEPVTDGTVSGGLHRMWLDITDLFAKGDTAAVERAEEGEDYLLKQFEDALEGTDLEPATRSLVLDTLGEVRASERLTDLLADHYY